MDLTEREKVLDEALEAAEEALNTWVHVHAPDECREEDVAASRARLMEGGTLWYLATVLQKVRTARAALATLKETGYDGPRTAPDSCPHCRNESDCSQVDICRAVDEQYPPTDKE